MTTIEKNKVNPNESLEEMKFAKIFFFHFFYNLVD